MNQQWLEIRIGVPTVAADTVCAVLGRIGSTGVCEREQQLDTFTVPDPDADLPETLELRAYFPADQQPSQLVAQIEQELDEVRRLFAVPGWTAATAAQVSDGEWAESWKQYFPVFRVGPLVVKPSWEDVDVDDAEVVLTIDPGMAFGTGHHETTRMALARLEGADLSGARVLDVGSGSGILAIAADLLGAASALGVDVDAATLPVAQENARLNRSRARFELGSVDPSRPEQRCDVLVANLFAELHAELAGAYAKALRPGGVAFLTGILDDRTDRVEAALPPSLRRLATDADGPWRLLALQRVGA